MEIMNICVLHLSDIERDTGSGVDREELIQWYLEQKETEFETEEDLEYERELIAKALTKLSRVSFILTIFILIRCKREGTRDVDKERERARARESKREQEREATGKESNRVGGEEGEEIEVWRITQGIGEASTRRQSGLGEARRSIRSIC